MNYNYKIYNYYIVEIPIENSYHTTWVITDLKKKFIKAKSLQEFHSFERTLRWLSKEFPELLL